MSVAKYRKKPVEIEAMLYRGPEDQEAASLWIDDGGGESDYSSPDHEVASARNSDSIYVVTLEGSMEASPGDYIIRGIKGEFYPCKPDIFAASYDPVA